MEYLEYRIESDALILGERIKGSIFRPSCKTLRWSTITNALRRFFGSNSIHAVGIFTSEPKTTYFVYSPMDRVRKISKIPLQVEILNNVRGKVYIVKNNSIKFPKEFNLSLGALISKGFGKCKLIFEREIINPQIRKGILNTRIPLKYIDKFLIKRIIKPIYGYLFEPISETSGVYVLSLFEGSEVAGPEFLLKDGENG